MKSMIFGLAYNISIVTPLTPLICPTYAMTSWKVAQTPLGPIWSRTINIRTADSFMVSGDILHYSSLLWFHVVYNILTVLLGGRGVRNETYTARRAR